VINIVEIYCVKCKTKVNVPESQLEIVPFRKKGNIKAWKGKHSCGTTMYRIIGKKK